MEASPVKLSSFSFNEDVSGDEDEIEMSEDEEPNEEALSKEQQLKKRLRESLGDVLAPSDEEV